MNMEDVFRAGVNHLLWKKRLEFFLEDKEDIDRTTVLSSKDCDVGKWLYSEDVAKYRAMTEMQEFELAHTQLHQIVRDVIALKEKGDIAAAKQEFQRLEALSKKIISLLTNLKRQIK
ncbi:CZB domain-containing protein [Candidatus Omnitrophota bacterium]